MATSPVNDVSTTSNGSPSLEGTKTSGHHQSFWLWVMCLTGVDYFSTLGYLPSIAYEATGVLAPVATILLVLVTLFGALPIYAYVAGKSPFGMGSISLLERLVSGWTGKFLILSLLGFVATAFIFTKTLSAADAAEHLVHNPLLQSIFPTLTQTFSADTQRILVTLIMLIVLGAMFLRGFREVIGLAVVIVGVYLLLNSLIIISGIWFLFTHPEYLNHWVESIHNPSMWSIEDPPLIGGDWVTILLLCIFFFPKLALGLSGFETGLMVMPLIKGDPDDERDNPKGRIRNTRKLLCTAAIIMCFYLLGSSFVTATLITPGEHAGKAANRALAFLAHGEGSTNINPVLFGYWFGSIYDLATVVILWFAGASAMAGLLNLVPQYLPRYGMAPEWARAIRPLILLFTLINLVVTWIFGASVMAQSGAYATGVLVFIFSGCAATLIDRLCNRPLGNRSQMAKWYVSLIVFSVITVIFLYTTVSIMINKPDGMLIAICVIVAIIGTSMYSRMVRSTELRFMGFKFVDEQSKFLWDCLKYLEFPVLVPHRPGTRSLPLKEESIRQEHRLTPDIPIVFLQVELGDASDFWQHPEMEIKQEEGRFIVKVTRCASIAHVIAAIGLELSKVGKPPEIHFGWSDENPLAANLGFLLFGEGNVPWMVRSLIRRAQRDPDHQPRIIVG